MSSAAEDGDSPGTSRQRQTKGWEFCRQNGQRGSSFQTCSWLLAVLLSETSALAAAMPSRSPSNTSSEVQQARKLFGPRYRAAWEPQSTTELQKSQFKENKSASKCSKTTSSVGNGARRSTANAAGRDAGRRVLLFWLLRRAHSKTLAGAGGTGCSLSSFPVEERGRLISLRAFRTRPLSGTSDGNSSSIFWHSGFAQGSAIWKLILPLAEDHRFYSPALLLLSTKTLQWFKL